MRLRVLLLIESGEATGDDAKLLLEAVHLQQTLVQLLRDDGKNTQTKRGYIVYPWVEVMNRG